MGFLQLGRSGAILHCGVWASYYSGFSCCGTRALSVWASVVAARGLSSWGMQALGGVGFSSCGVRALEHRLSSCGAWA